MTGKTKTKGQKAMSKLSPVHFLYPTDNDVANVLHLFLANVVNRHGGKAGNHFTVEALWRALTDREAVIVARLAVLRVLATTERQSGLAAELHDALCQCGMKIVLMHGVSCVQGVETAWRSLPLAAIHKLHGILVTVKWDLMDLRVPTAMHLPETP